MCLSKVYYNSYADGEKDVTEKMYACREGRRCSHPEVRKYDRKFPFAKLGESQPESHRSVSERRPTPYFSRGSKSPSPSSRHYDPYDNYDHHRSSRHDPRDRYEREGRRRSGSLPHIIYDRPRSRSHDYSRDIPLGVQLADDYGRRKSSSRSRSRDDLGREDKYYRRRTDDPLGYVFIDDADERRRQRREQRRSSYHEPSTSAGGAMDNSAYDSHRYAPRRASTVVHNSDGTLSTFSSGLASSKAKSIRWDDEVRAKRSRQNAEIANRPVLHGEGSPPKSILKKPGSAVDPRSKGKGRDIDDVDDRELRRAIERMEIPSGGSRGRDREPRSSSGLMDDWTSSYDQQPDRERRKRSKIYATGGGADDRYRYL
ncbi:hypothetical protein QBC38DRAFT_270072 [Podospora fimiseda]|uniref:Uncharacterized protein n=1 Tax=Podospora fimiseda TaxID=252190 RepID=A0AAN7GYL7_9PEZI|nr:hypothetical protein QBC38DRAFT_270072 [Podospora fimiseda]